MVKKRDVYYSALLAIIIFSAITLIVYNDRNEMITGNAISLEDSTLLGKYSFEDNHDDETGRSTGTLYSGEYVEGVVGRALNFDGSNDFMNIQQSIFERNNELSIAFWVNFEKTGDHQIIFWEGNEGADGLGPLDESNIYIENSGEVIGLWVEGDGKDLRVYSPIEEKKWSHLTFVLRDLDTQTPKAELYFNGNLTNKSNSTSFVNRTYNQQIILGRSITNEKRFKGSLDELYIFTSAISQSQVSELFQEGVECNSDLDCPLENTLNSCSGDKACIEIKSHSCKNPGDLSSRCEENSEIVCKDCNIACRQGQCVEEDQESILQDLDIPENVGVQRVPEPSFWTKMKCRIFHPFSAENYEACWSE